MQERAVTHRSIHILPADIIVGITASILDNVISTYLSHNMNTGEWNTYLRHHRDCSLLQSGHRGCRRCLRHRRHRREHGDWAGCSRASWRVSSGGGRGLGHSVSDCLRDPNLYISAGSVIMHRQLGYQILMFPDLYSTA